MSAMDLRHCLSRKCLSVAGDASSQCLSSVYSSHSTISGHGREDCRICRCPAEKMYRHSAWLKLVALRAVLPKYEYVLYLGLGHICQAAWHARSGADAPARRQC